MDPNAILVLLKVLDIASALFARIGERDAQSEAFVAKVREIIREKGGQPSDEDFAELLEGSNDITGRLEDLLASKENTAPE